MPKCHCSRLNPIAYLFDFVRDLSGRYLSEDVLVPLPMKDADQLQAEVNQLNAKVATLEELLTVYEQSAVAQTERLQTAMQRLRDRANRLEHAEATLQTLQSILDSMGEAVVVVDSHGQPLFVNPAAMKILGLDPAAPNLKDWLETCNVCLPDQVTPYPWAEFPLNQALSGHTVDSVEMFIGLPKTATTAFWLSANAGPLYDPDGEIFGGVVAFRDATQRKRNEAALRQSKEAFKSQAQQLETALSELRQAQTRLVQSEKMAGLEQLVAGIAHEVNNPVNFILGNISHAHHYLQDILDLLLLYQQHFPQVPKPIETQIREIDLPYLTADFPKLLQSMESGANRINQIVQSLRNFSRLDEATVKTVDVHEGLDNTVMILSNRLQASRSSAAIQVIREYQQLPKVACLAGQINQVFLHILDNAIDALTPQRALQAVGQDAADVVISPIIWIRTALLATERVRIEIANNGPPIPDQVRNRIFDPFFTTKPVGKGTGMGMSISYQVVVEQHQGSLECISDVQGVTFLIELPVEFSEAAYPSVSL